MEESDLTPTFSVVKEKKKERDYFVCNKTVICTVEATYANKLNTVLHFILSRIGANQIVYGHVNN